MTLVPGALLAAVPTDGGAGQTIQQALAGHAGEGALRQFYADRGYRPFWEPARAELLLERLNVAWVEGLSPARFPLARLEQLLHSDDPRLVGERELLFSEAYLRYARELASGRVEAKSDPDWHIRHVQVSRGELLDRLAGSQDLAALLDTLPPQTEAYGRLRSALAHYRKLAAAGGWPTLADGPKLEPGDQDERVPTLRERLKVTGEWSGEPPAEPLIYDDQLVEAVSRFQARHGLEPDGVIGKRTFIELNVSAEQRVRQILVSMERTRWLPRDLGEQAIRVNVPGFELEVVEQGRTVMGMKVVAGRPARATPSFQATMSHLVFNPFWSIPTRILREDVVPAAQKDPKYLAKKHIRILSGDGGEVSPEEIDWEEVKETGGFPYRLRRDPGDDNDLGKVKFLLPNRFDIYLHDTPSRKLFGKAHRAYSSGCIRLERPLDLAALALGWEMERINQAVESGKTREVRLPRAIPVYIFYQTAWVDADGVVQFREDLYRRDGAVWRAMSAS